jgi:hypothetical protein
MARHIPAVLVVALALGACGSDNYFPANDIDRRGTGQAEGINDRNLRAQVANPAHLTRGASAATDRGDQASAAIRALNAGRRPPLPEGLSDVGAGGGGASGVTSGGGGGGGGGGQN